MNVTITYQQAHSIKFPKGDIDIPQHLGIEFTWKDLAEGDNDDRVAYVDVGHDMEMAIWTEEPMRILGIFGPIPEMNDWRLAPDIIGNELWQRAVSMVGAASSEIVIDIDEAHLASFRERWIRLYEDSQITQVRPIPPSRAERDRAIDIVMSDPDFVRRGNVAVRKILEHVRDQSKPK